MSDLDAQQKDVVTALLGQMQDNQPLALDPADPRARAAIDLFLDLSNKGSDRYPGLHDGLAQAARNGGGTGGTADRPTIVDLGRDRGGRATSRTWVSTPGQPLISGAATLVLDAESHDSLAFGTATQLGESLVQVATDSGSAKAAPRRQTVLSISHAQGSADEAPRFTAVQRTLTAYQTEPPVTIHDPKPQISGHNVIVIGLARNPGQNKDCDYPYTFGMPVPPPLLVPFTGNISLPYSILGIDPGTGFIDQLQVESCVYVGLSQSGASPATNPSQLYKGCTANPNSPNVLTWSFPFNATANPSTSIYYNPSSRAQDAKSAFYFQFTVPVDDPGSPYVFAVCSDDTPGQPSVQCFHVKDLDFTWHCLAADTQVTRADGTPVRIIDVDSTIRVRTGLGDGTLAVEATWRGTHDQMVRLSTESGHSLLSTPAHPIMTPVGLVAAGELAAGTHVMLEGGASSALAAVEVVEYGGTVCNLMLGNHEDRAAGLAHTAGMFVANGIVVGDFRAQGRIHRASRRSIDFMHARIPQSHHRDYESALADARF